MISRAFGRLAIAAFMMVVGFQSTIALAQVDYLHIEGQYSYELNFAADSAQLHVDQIQNSSSTNTTGTLRLELWATAAPYSGGSISGYRIAMYQITGSSNGSLGPNQYFSNINATVPILEVPPDGTYYPTLILTEYNPGDCTSSDHFCIDTYGGFDTLLVIGQPSQSFQIVPGITGEWYDTAQSGHGFSIEILTGNRILASWYVYSPEGGQAWISGQGTYVGNVATLTAYQKVGSGGLFPPYFNASGLELIVWGTMTLTFADCNHATIDYSSVISGYGSGSLPLSRLTEPAGLSCP